MGTISRETRDLDVIAPVIDSGLLRCAQTIAGSVGLDKEWLNNGPSGFVKDLERGWIERSVVIFQGKNLTLKALCWRDFIATKLQGMCDRDEYDLEDIVSLKPSEEEILSLKNWLLNQDASAYWPDRVEKQLNQLISRIRNEK